MLLSTDTTIGKLRIRGASADTPALRLAVAHLVERADLRVSGLPSSHVLIVRRLRDPLPGGIAPAQKDSAGTRHGWERAVQNTLQQLSRQAARPDRSGVPEGADSVLFLDEAEMLAALAFDLCRNVAHARWYWASVLRTLPGHQALSHLFSSNAAFVPAAFYYLAQWQEAERVAGSLTSEQAMDILENVGRAFKVRWDAKAAGMRGTTAKDSIPSGPASQEIEPGPREETPAPWTAWLSGQPLLGKAQTCLLGSALTLFHDPPTARSTAFGQGVRDWWQGVPARRDNSNPVPSGNPSSSPPNPPTGQSITEGGMPSAPDGNPSSQRQADHVDPSGAPIHSESAADPRVQDNSPHARPKVRPRPISLDNNEERKPLGPKENQAGRDGDIVPEPLRECQAEVVAPSPRTQLTRATHSQQISEDDEKFESQSEPRFFPAEEFIDTHLGGVLYLINVLRALDLPVCFEADWSLSEDVGTWGLLELLARALLAEANPVFAEDPLWLVLAHWEGRQPGEWPGGDRVGPDSYRIPKAWFHEWGNEKASFCWTVSEGRLRLWSQAGFLLVETARTNEPPERQAFRELSIFTEDGELHPAEALSSPLAVLGDWAVNLNGKMVRWLEFVVPCLRARLEAAMGGDLQSGHRLAERFFACPGRLFMTRTHIDFVSLMDHISLPVRKAGLDQNPGWVPEVGRVVLFHFESPGKPL